MKCLIVGGGGFIGTHLTDALLAQGHGVRVFDRPNLAHTPRAGVEWVEGDFLNEDDISRAVQGCEAIFHLAWTTLPKSSNDNAVYDCETNLVGTLGLLEAARKAGVAKMLFCSSGGTVYGVPRQLPIPESHATEPMVSYGITKLAVEKYLKLYKGLYGLDCTVLRVANPFGERQRLRSAQGAVTIFLDKALRGEVIDIWGNGDVVRDYIYIADVADAFVRAMAYRGDIDVFNIGSGQGRSLNDILASIERVLGRPAPRRYLSARKFDVPANVLDISLAERALDWTPHTPFEHGLARTLEWLKGKPASDDASPLD